MHTTTAESTTGAAFGRPATNSSEREVRVALAALYRCIALQGWDDHIFTHLSARVPEEPGHLLLNRMGQRFEEVTASSLVKTDMRGNTVGDTALITNLGAAVIHGAVYQARPEARCVLHLHTRANGAVAACKDGLLPISQHAMVLHGNVAFHDYEGLAIDFSECQRLADDMGDKHIVILRNHGSLVWGESLPVAFALTYWFERACELQVDAMGAGRENLVCASEEVAATTASQGADFSSIAEPFMASHAAEARAREPGI